MAVDPRFYEQARSFITETMKSVVPNANVDGGSGINAILGRGSATISAALLQEIEHVLTTRDLTDPEALSETDMDLLLENLLTARDGGDLAFGFVRLYYADRGIREFGAGLTATTEDKLLNFVTLADLSFFPENYFLDPATGDYFINVPFTAEEAGEDYNVDAGEIVQLVNDQSGAKRVTNIAAFRNGKSAQTNTQALRKAQRAVSTRTPLSRDGTIFFFQSLFGAKLQDLLVVGAGDPEMLRDEVWDMGEGEEPRFQVGVDSLNPVTRAQMGTAQELHVGGRTDVYSLYDSVNFVQKNVDLFADMALDSAITTFVATIQATFIPGTTGVVAASGKLIIDLGNTGEETVAYSSVVNAPAGSGSYVFTLVGLTAQTHDPGATVKVVNNNDLTVGPGADIDILPVFQISDVRLLDPVTFEPIGSSLPETTADSKTPGWYVTRTNPYDLLSARETKSIVIDEKTNRAGNQALNVSAGTTATVVIGGGNRTQYEGPGADFTDYEGREVTLSDGVTTTTRTVLQVLSPPNKIVVSGDPLTPSVGNVNAVIEAAFGDYNQYPVRVSYYTNTEIGEAQDFLDQDSRRILAGDVLSRAFLPVFLDFTMRYRGDGSPDEIRDNINEVLQTSSGDAIGESSGAKFEYSDLINAAYTDGLANYVETPFQVRIRRQQLDGSVTVDYINPDRNTVSNMAMLTGNGITVFSGDGNGSGTGNIFVSNTQTFGAGDIGKKIWIKGIGLATIVALPGPSDEAELDITFESTINNVDWSYPVFFLTARLPAGSQAFAVPESGRLFLGGFTGNQEVVDYSSVIDEGNEQYTFIVAPGHSINLPHPADEPMRVSVADYDDANVITSGVITDERTYRPFLGSVVIEQL